MKKILALIVAFTVAKTAISQIGLGVTTPHPNAYFQINSTNKGVLLPRMTALQRIAIAPAATANGLIVFDTDSSAYLFWTGTTWKKMGGDDGNWIKNGNNIYNSNLDNIGIGISNPVAKLHVADGSVLFGSTTFNSANISTPPPAEGSGVRMMWYPQRAAFRAGLVDDGTFIGNAPGSYDNKVWDRDSIGVYSFAAGYNTKAKGQGDVVMGLQNESSGGASALFGINNKSYGFANFSMGNGNAAYGNYNTSFGENNITSGNYTLSIGKNNLVNDSGIVIGSGNLLTGLYGNIALGNYNQPNGVYTTTIGFGNRASGIFSFAAGYNSSAISQGAVAIGMNNYAGAEFSSAFGYNNVSNSPGGTVVGMFNDPFDDISQNRIFQVGNGFSSSTRSNAMTILTNGNVGIGTVTPNTTLNVAGNVSFQGGYFQYENGTEGDGKVLTSNLSGIANWQDPSLLWPRFWSLNGNNIYKNNTGNVGIGTNSPSSALHINGQLRVEDGTQAAGYVLTSDVTGLASWQPPVGSNWNTNVNDIYNNNSGNVGIGNSAPITPLSFQSSLGNKISLWGVDVNNHYGFGVQGSLLQVYSAGVGDDIAFGYGSSNNFAERMRIKGNGNVGIGTNSPNAALQFANTLVNRKLVLYDLNNNDHQYYGFGINSSLLRYQVDATTADHVFSAGVNTSSSAELMRIKGNGNVGVGVSDPVYRLDVNGRMRVRSGGDANSTAGIWLNNNANNISPAFVGMESDDAVGFYGNGTPNGWGVVMKIGSGNVGIGTSIPSEKLHVVGNILATGTITPSDIRYKNSIITIQNPLVKLAALHGVTYFMNREAHPEWQFDSTLQYGLIAQEVEKVFPEIVKVISADGYKGLDYVKLVPVLLEGVKELDKKNNQLTADNQMMRERLTILEEKVNALMNEKPVK